MIEGQHQREQAKFYNGSLKRVIRNEWRMNGVGVGLSWSAWMDVTQVLQPKVYIVDIHTLRYVPDGKEGFIFLLRCVTAWE